MEHKVEEVKLKCGAKGLLIDVPEAPVFCMELWFRAGNSTVKDSDKYETAHIMEHLACGANSQHSTMAEVDRYIRKNGAVSNAFTGRDYLGYERICPDFDWERILRQLVVQLTTPKFLEKEFKAEFGNVEEEAKLRSNNHWWELGLVMGKKFGWGYYDTWLERLEKMQSVTVDDVREHYKRTHGADNAVFFIAGNMENKKDTILEILEGLNKLPKTKKYELYRYPTIKGYEHPVVIKKNDVPNIYFTIETYAELPLWSIEKLMVNINILNKILDDGDHSRIYGKARSRGLVYALEAGGSYSKDGKYSWEISCQVGDKNMDDLLDLVVAEVSRIQSHPLTKDEVDEAITSIKGSLRMKNQTASSILGWNSDWYTKNEVERVYNFEDVDKWYDAVTPESIQELFINLIKTKKWGAGFLGNVTEAQAKKWDKKLAEIFAD